MAAGFMQSSKILLSQRIPFGTNMIIRFGDFEKHLNKNKTT